MSEINWKDKCFVTTIYLIRDDFKVLLTFNKNLQTWIPVGGHLDEGETPEDAVKREVQEETGFDFEFFPSPEFENDGKVKVLKIPTFQIEDVPHHGKHMNFIFFGKVINYSEEKTETDEEEKLRWFSKEELLQEDMLESVRKRALEALEEYSNL